MPPIINLPVASRPYQHDSVIPDDAPEEEKILHTVVESSVILQSLRQSRERWLSSMFPPFSAKAKGSKYPAIVPPPHTIRSHGRFELAIGPHVFHNTAIYEVRYLHAPPSLSPSAQGSDQPIANALAVGNPGHLAFPSTQSLTPSTSPSQASSDVFVTPTLVNQVNAAAASNPVLANLLQQAVQGRATPDQMKTLGLLIQTLGDIESQIVAPPNAAPASLSSLPSSLNGARVFDVVIEFQERPFDRWTLPRAAAVVAEPEPVAVDTPGNNLDVRIALPHANKKPSNSEVQERPASDQPALLRWVGVSSSARDLMFRWGSSQLMTSRDSEQLRAKAVATSERTFLQYQLPNGPLFASIQAALAPPFSMKSIKPAQYDNVRPRRRPITRGTRAKVSVEIPMKRKRDSNQATRIACHTCQRTDVPLLMGGRYCRACVGAKSASEAALTPLPDPTSRATVQPLLEPTLNKLVVG